MAVLTRTALEAINKRVDAKSRRILDELNVGGTALDTLKINVRADSRVTKRAGVYYPHKHTIEINLKLLEVFEDPAKEYEDTLLHEIAHAICAVVWPVRDFADNSDWPQWAFDHHGTQWKTVMKLLGQKPDKTFSITPRQKAQFAPKRYSVVRCPGCKREYSITRRAVEILETDASAYFKCLNSACKALVLGASHIVHLKKNPPPEYFKDDVVMSAVSP